MYFPGITRNPSSNSLTPHPALTPTRLHAPPTLLTPHPSPLPSSGSPPRSPHTQTREDRSTEGHSALQGT